MDNITINKKINQINKKISEFEIILNDLKNNNKKDYINNTDEYYNNIIEYIFETSNKFDIKEIKQNDNFKEEIYKNIYNDLLINLSNSINEIKTIITDKYVKLYNDLKEDSNKETITSYNNFLKKNMDEYIESFIEKNIKQYINIYLEENLEKNVNNLIKNNIEHHINLFLEKNIENNINLFLEKNIELYFDKFLKNIIVENKLNKIEYDIDNKINNIEKQFIENINKLDIENSKNQEFIKSCYLKQFEDKCNIISEESKNILNNIQNSSKQINDYINYIDNCFTIIIPNKLMLIGKNENINIDNQISIKTFGKNSTLTIPSFMVGNIENYEKIFLDNIPLIPFKTYNLIVDALDFNNQIIKFNIELNNQGYLNIIISKNIKYCKYIKFDEIIINYINKNFFI